MMRSATMVEPPKYRTVHSGRSTGYVWLRYAPRKPEIEDKRTENKEKD